MRFGITKKGVVVTLAAAVLVAGGGWLVLKPEHTKNTTSSSTTQNTAQTPTSQPTAGSQATTTQTGTFIETADFKYEIPAGWIQMKKEVLDQIGATSGIGRLSSSTAVFKTSDSSQTFSTNSALKDNVVNGIKDNAKNFKLVSSGDAKVDSKSGIIVVYTFTDSAGNNKLRQQLNAVQYKNKTFILVASSTDGDFDKQTGEFKAILASFKFK